MRRRFFVTKQLLSVVLHQASCHDPASGELACPHASLVESVNRLQETWELFVVLAGVVVALSVVAYTYGQYTDETQ